jgi:hypothetical protein
MGKRSNFERRERDTYDTPAKAVLPLLPHIDRAVMFVDPCAGSGALVTHLEAAGHVCIGMSDIAPRAPGVARVNMLKARVPAYCDFVITNPPWERKLLHAFIERLRAIGRTAWLLFDTGWMFTQQAQPYLPYISRIVTVGRVRWIEGTKDDSLDDAAWYLIHPTVQNATVFYGQQKKERTHDGKGKGKGKTNRPQRRKHTGRVDEGVDGGGGRRPGAGGGAVGGVTHDA